MTTSSRLYGLYIHNLTKLDDRRIALDTADKIINEKPPYKYEYGDVIVLQTDHDVSDMVREILVKNGFIVDFMLPTHLYRLRDTMIVHYLFVDKYIKQSETEEFVYNWETSNKLTLADLRYTRYIKTFFMKET